MNVTELRLDITKNLGNYESKKAGATVAVGEGESLEEARNLLNSTIDSILNETVVEEKKEPAVKKKVAKKTTKKTTTRKKAVVEEKVATLEQAQQAARKFKEAKGSSAMVKALIEEITGKEKLREVEDASIYAKFVDAVEERCQ